MQPWESTHRDYYRLLGAVAAYILKQCSPSVCSYRHENSILELGKREI